MQGFCNSYKNDKVFIQTESQRQSDGFAKTKESVVSKKNRLINIPKKCE